ncbi:MAG: hypothetical protein IJV45_03690 [Prevotella sp.]|nr:hypothetical protein [Prevotella sp.]
MDPLTKTLNTHLVAMAYQGATYEQEHQMEHLLALLDPDDEELILHYYGLFGHERLALDDLAAHRHEQPDETLAAISRLLRRIAVTPEWQMIKPQTA